MKFVMDNFTHSYRLTLSRQIGYFCLGLLFALFGSGLVALFLFSNDKNLFDRCIFIFALIPLIYMLAIGIVFMATPFVTKVTTSFEGVEYHLPTLIVAARWQNIESFERQESGKTHLILVPTEGTVNLRRWARIVHWLFRKDVTSFHIDASRFAPANGQPLDSDIIAFRIRKDGI